MTQMEWPDQAPSDFSASTSRPPVRVAAAISAFVDRGPFGVAVVDTDLRFLLVSRGLAALHGHEVLSIVGRRIDEVLSPPQRDRVEQALRRVLDSGVPMVDAETWGTLADPGAERSFTSSFYRLDDASGSPLGVVVLVTETTELRSAATSASSAEAQLELLQWITEALSVGESVADVTEATLSGAVQVVGASGGAFVWLEPTSDRLLMSASTGLGDGSYAQLQEPADPEARLPHCDALRSGAIVVWGSRAERDLDYPAFAVAAVDHEAWAFVPMTIRAEEVGVLVLAWRSARRFGVTDMALLDAVGRQCGAALSQARVLDAEREARRAMEFLVEVTRFVVESSEEGVYAMSTGHRVLTFNRRFCELMGIPETAIEVGAEAGDVLLHWRTIATDPGRVDEHLLASKEQPFDHLTVDLELTDGRVLTCTSSPIIDRRNVALGRVWYFRDETRRRIQEAEQQLALEELRASHEHQTFLLDAAEIVSQAEGYSETLQRLAAVAVPTLADLCLVDTLTWDERIVRMAAKHSDPRCQPLVDELESNYAPDPAGAHPSIEVMHTGRVRWSATMSDEFLRKTSRDDHHFELLKRLRFTSYMALPLVAENRILGSITLVSAGSGRRFGPKDLALADDFTSCVAQVVAAAHRHDAARHAAQTLQASLLPDDIPEVRGLEIAVRYLPATLDNEVGGDFYDVIRASSGVVTVVIGDVAGHDMQAAAVMGKVRTAVRVLASQATGPRHFIEMLRLGWENLELERMATMLIAHADPRSGELRIVSAGHPPPLLVANGYTKFLDVRPTTPFGAPPSDVHEWRGTLAKGSALLLFTDGLVEDHQRSYEDGTVELQRAASGHFEPDELCDHVLEEMLRDELHHDDDIALVALARSATRS